MENIPVSQAVLLHYFHTSFKLWRRAPATKIYISCWRRLDKIWIVSELYFSNFKCWYKTKGLSVQVQQEPGRQFYSTLQKNEKRRAKNKQHSSVGQWSAHFSKSRGRDSDINHCRENSHCQENTGSLRLSREVKRLTECQAIRTNTRSNKINCSPCLI